MNKSGFQIKNNYFRAALYMKLIVNKMKYRGIHCDFGRLTDLFFVIPDLLSFAVQRDTDFFQYTYNGQGFNPAQKGVLNEAGIALSKGNVPPEKCEFPRKNPLNKQDYSEIRNRMFSWPVIKRKFNSFYIPQFPVRGLGYLESRAIRACLVICIYNN
jgi:hypothetical protein